MKPHAWNPKPPPKNDNRAEDPHAPLAFPNQPWIGSPRPRSATFLKIHLTTRLSLHKTTQCHRMFAPRAPHTVQSSDSSAGSDRAKVHSPAGSHNTLASKSSTQTNSDTRPSTTRHSPSSSSIGSPKPPTRTTRKTQYTRINQASQSDEPHWLKSSSEPIPNRNRLEMTSKQSSIPLYAGN